MYRIKRDRTIDSYERSPGPSPRVSRCTRTPFTANVSISIPTSRRYASILLLFFIFYFYFLFLFLFYFILFFFTFVLLFLLGLLFFNFIFYALRLSLTGSQPFLIVSVNLFSNLSNRESNWEKTSLSVLSILRFTSSWL